MQSPSEGPTARAVATRLVLGSLAVLAVLWAGRDIMAQWRAFRASDEVLHLQPLPILASSVLVLFAYIVLVETWRAVVRSSGGHLGFGRAMHIWFVSNLGRYVPGKIWQIGAMGALAKRAGVAPSVAIGSSLVVNLVNLLVGLGLALATGAEFAGSRDVAYALGVAMLLGLAALPLGIPWLARVAGRIVGRSLDLPTLTPWSLWRTALGCLIAWLSYGLAFRWLVSGVLGSAPGPVTSYIAAFTGSYLLGYIALFSPGGVGVREASLSVMLRQLALPIAGSAGIIAIASRLWLTVLEVLPGLLLIIWDALSAHRPTSSFDSTE